MQCPYCHKLHPDQAQFCPETGQKILKKHPITVVYQQLMQWIKKNHSLFRYIVGGIWLLVFIIVISMIVGNVFDQFGSGKSNTSSPIFGQRIPPEVEKAIRDVYVRGNGAFGWKLDKVSQIEVTGQGRVPDDNYHAGIEEVYCANVKIDATQDTAGRYLWFTYFVYRTGNYWEASHASSGQSSWDRYACPGMFRGR